MVVSASVADPFSSAWSLLVLLLLSAGEYVVCVVVSAFSSPGHLLLFLSSASCSLPLAALVFPSSGFCVVHLTMLCGFSHSSLLVGVVLYVLGESYACSRCVVVFLSGFLHFGLFPRSTFFRLYPAWLSLSYSVYLFRLFVWCFFSWVCPLSASALRHSLVSRRCFRGGLGLYRYLSFLVSFLCRLARVYLISLSSSFLYS